MEEEHSTFEASAAAAAIAVTSDSDEDMYCEKEFREGLRKALYHKRNRENANILLSPERRDELLEESFPKIHHPEDGNTATIKELTETEYAAIRTGLQEAMQSDERKKMALLQEQLSEYHSVLEDVIAYKSRCERLDQEKKDLVSLGREACRVRDNKIAMLEREVAQLRNERHRSSSGGSSDWATPIISSGGSEGQYAHGHHLQQSHLHPTPVSTQTLSRKNTHDPRRYYSNGGSRRITIDSPSSIELFSGTGTGAIRPPPFPGSVTPSSMHPRAIQEGVFFHTSSIGENRSVKRYRSD